jgi:hypothetical protein
MKNSKDFKDSFLRDTDINEFPDCVELPLFVNDFKNTICYNILFEENFSQPLDTSSNESIYEYGKAIKDLFIGRREGDDLVFLNEIVSKPHSDILVLEIYIVNGISNIQGIEINKISAKLSRLDETSWGNDMQERNEAEKEQFSIKLSNLCNSLRKAEFAKKNRKAMNRSDVWDHYHFSFPYNGYDNRGD